MANSKITSASKQISVFFLQVWKMFCIEQLRLKNVVYNFVPKVSAGCVYISTSCDFGLKMTCNCAFTKNMNIFILPHGCRCRLSVRNSKSCVVLVLDVVSASVLQGKMPMS